jgi:hypothetical protein
MTRGTAALAIAILDIAGYVILIAWGLMTSAPGLASDPFSAVLALASVVAFASMGALLIRRAPSNLIGALLLATATTQVVGLALQGYWTVGVAADPPWPGAAIVAALTDVWYTAPFVIALVGVPLVFPDGRLPSRRFRRVVWVTVAGTVLQALAGLVRLIPGLTDVEAIATALVIVSVIATIIGFGGAGVAIWVRFRRGDPVERQQVKWLLADVGVAVVAFPPAMMLGSSNSFADLAFWLVGYMAFLGLPVAIGIAVLRYRLYEIDRIVSRTIGYLIVTATLAFVFAGGILLFEAVLAPLTGGNTVGVAASTLVAAALFQPLRRRVQRVVDRRFNRARYDAERAVAAFAAQLRDDVDLESVSADVLGVVARTVAPATVGLWIRRSEVEP